MCELSVEKSTLHIWLLGSLNLSALLQHVCLSLDLFIFIYLCLLCIIPVAVVKIVKTKENYFMIFYKTRAWEDKVLLTNFLYFKNNFYLDYFIFYIYIITFTIIFLKQVKVTKRVSSKNALFFILKNKNYVLFSNYYIYIYIKDKRPF